MGAFAPLFLACCSKAHPTVRRELALRAQTALLTGAGFRQEQQRLETKIAAKHPWQLPFLGSVVCMLLRQKSHAIQYLIKVVG